MKKLLITIAWFIPVILNAFTGEIEVNGIKYSISTKEQSAKAIGLSDPNYTGAIVIPGSIVYEDRTCYVNSVEGFESSQGITSLTLGDGIQTITSNAFKGCANLSNISIPNSISNLSSSAFEGTAWLDNEPDGVVYLGTVAYKYKGEMPKDAEITIKDGTMVIAMGCFSRMENLKKITFPSTLKYINRSAFQGTSLSSLSLNDVVLDGYTFRGCASLSSLFLNNVKIGESSFANCTNLKDITMIDVENGNIDSYKYNAFDNCDNIESVTINRKSVEPWFKGKASLKNLVLGDEVEEIQIQAFSGTGITSLTFPKNLKYLAGFDKCQNLTAIDVPSNVQVISYYAFSGCTNLAEVELHQGLKKIEDAAFQECSSLEEIEIPSSVDSIEGGYVGVFSSCTSLKKVVLHSGIKEIGSSTFWGCKSLREIILPEGLSIIRNNLLSACENLRSVSIPRSVTSIQEYAFQNCKELTDVYCYSPSAPTLRSTSFYDAGIQYVTLHVPAQAIESYKTATIWKDFKEIVAIPNYEAMKCSSPKISYQEGKLIFTCETEGAQCVSEITDADVKKSTEEFIDLTATYHISVYATAPEHLNSDTVFATLCWIDTAPKTEGLTNNIMKVNGNALLIQAEGGLVKVSGAEDGTQICVYDMSGRMVGNSKDSSNSQSINTELRGGQVGIVKIGEKSVKILMK